MRTASRLTIGMAVLLGIGLCAGCLSLRVQASTRAARIQGSWQLDAAASDNTTAAIDKAIAAQRERQRRRRGRRPPPQQTAASGSTSPGSTADDSGDDDFDLDEGPDGSPARGPGIDFKALRNRLQLALDTPMQLDIRVGVDYVDITPQGLPGRTYRPGERFSRIDEYGTASMRSGWADDAFVLQSRYENRGIRTEKYSVDSEGRLLISVDLDDPTVGKLRLNSRYRRTGP